jgi:MerR family redox-sensitive transcriptional activator SoxR
MSDEAAVLTIGEVAARTGVRASALRYYEEAGLVPRARRRGGKRVYAPAVLDRLAVIELAKSAGFTIRETRTLLAGLTQRRPAARTWQRLARGKLDELSRRIAEASRMRTLLETLVTCDCPTLEDCGRELRRARQGADAGSESRRPARRTAAGVDGRVTRHRGPS